MLNRWWMRAGGGAQAQDFHVEVEAQRPGLVKKLSLLSHATSCAGQLCFSIVFWSKCSWIELTWKFLHSAFRVKARPCEVASLPAHSWSCRLQRSFMPAKRPLWDRIWDAALLQCLATDLRCYLQVDKPASPLQEAALLQAAMTLFSRNVKEPFHLTLFNLGATNFAEAGPSGAVSIQQAFKMTQQAAQPLQAAQEAAQRPGEDRASTPLLWELSQTINKFSRLLRW